MTPEPKPPILTKEQAQNAYDDASYTRGAFTQLGLKAIATEKTKVVPVRSEAQESERFEAWKRKTWPNAGIMQGAMMHSAWLAATRDA